MTLDTSEQEPLVVPAASVPSPVVVSPWGGMRWSAIIAGVIVAAGVWLLLHALGLGIGLTAVDPQQPSSMRGVGIGTGIWSFIVPLAALFVGGMTTGYLTGEMVRIRAVIHGAVLWSLATILSLLLMIWIVGGLLGGAARLGGQVVGAAGTVAAQGISGLGDPSLDVLGTGEGELVSLINERLRATGRPTVTEAELRAATRDALNTSVRQGRVDRDILVQSLATHTALTPQDAQGVVADIEREWQQQAAAASARMRSLGADAQTAALQAVESTGKALLVLFFLLAVGLVAAIGGVLLAISRHERRRRRVTEGPVTRTGPPDQGGTIMPPD
jgi:hypothetical protein